MKDDDEEDNSKGVASSNCFSYYKEMKFEHEGHPQDTLTLQLIHASFRCDACNVTDEGLFYRCDSCDFWIHKTCASLAPTADIPHHHHEHPLLLIYSLRVIVANFVTNTFDGMDAWLYHCGNYIYFAYIVRATNAQKQPSTPRDDPSNLEASEGVNSLLHFQLPRAFTDPWMFIHSTQILC